MSCKKEFSYDFTIKNLNREWIENTYKKHYKQVLIDKEISKLPETMNLVERDIQVEQLQNKQTEYLKARLILKKQMNELNNEIGILNRNIWNIKATKPQGKKKFIMACANEECRGFLSSAYKCELCKFYTCTKCHECTGFIKDDPSHTCDPDNVKSAELIKQETKPCPSCGVRIFKINGCNQMWCTECHQAFDWKTGLSDNGTVHNPHYYQFQRDNTGTVARNPGDNPCGGYPTWWEVSRKLKTTLSRIGASNDDFIRLSSKLGSIFRIIQHIRFVSFIDLQRRMRTSSDLSSLRIKYIRNKITKEDFMKEIYKQNITVKENQEKIHLYGMLIHVSEDEFKKLLELFASTQSHVPWEEFIEKYDSHLIELNAFRIYFNDNFKQLSAVYKHKMPFMTEKWTIDNCKTTFLDLKNEQLKSLYPKGEGGI